jgi:hypothetical protein
VVRTVALMALRRLLGVLGLGSTPDTNEVEIAVLWHQLAVLQRQVVRPTYTPGDRMLLAMLARMLPRNRWAARSWNGGCGPAAANSSTAPSSTISDTCCTRSANTRRSTTPIARTRASPTPGRSRLCPNRSPDQTNSPSYASIAATASADSCTSTNTPPDQDGCNSRRYNAATMSRPGHTVDARATERLTPRQRGRTPPRRRTWSHPGVRGGFSGVIQNRIDKLKALTGVIAGQGPVCVELRGFEPLTPSMRTRCATGLRHSP